jgi:hypothetical protein
MTTDLANSDRELFWPSALWVVTVSPSRGRIIGYAQVIYIQAIIVIGVP